MFDYLRYLLAFLMLLFGSCDNNEISANAKKKLVEPNTPHSFTNSIGMKFHFFEPGAFMMGAPSINHYRPIEKLWDQDLHRRRITEISNGFYLAETEVTNSQWEKIMGEMPAYGSSNNPNFPAEAIKWEDAIEFCKRLSKKEGLNYRLPSEAEWEYAAHGGNKSNPVIDEFIAIEKSRYELPPKNSKTEISAVKSNGPDSGNLYNMFDNVQEVCLDYYGTLKGFYQKDPLGPSKVCQPIDEFLGNSPVPFRVARGFGKWQRKQIAENSHSANLGLRVLIDLRAKPLRPSFEKDFVTKSTRLRKEEPDII
jgi:formylglycine-generating enzyme required for sulfatase activity